MQAFSNLRVIDLTHVLAGPFCTYQLAVMGAEVIKIEPTDMPDMMRATTAEFPHGQAGLSSGFMAQNANKKAISLNLKSEPSKDILRTLIQTADVLVENYRAGALADLGFSYASTKKIKPDIIYCSLTGFGQTGPLSDRTAYDNVIQAYSGLMSASGSKSSAPVKVGPPVLDYGTGIQSAFAIAAALFQRTKTGKGQYIDVAMLDSALMLMSSNTTYVDHHNQMLPLTGNKSSKNAGYSCYETQQDLLMIGAYTGNQIKNLWKVLGDEEYGMQFAGQQPPAMAETLQQDEIKIAKILKTKTAKEWEILLNANHVSAARVRKLDETLQDQQLAYRGVLQNIETNQGLRKLPVTSFRYANNGPKIHSAPPVFAQHTEQVLQDLGYSQDDIQTLVDTGAIAIAR